MEVGWEERGQEVGKSIGLRHDFAIHKEFELHSTGDVELLGNIWQLNDSQCSFPKDSRDGILA